MLPGFLMCPPITGDIQCQKHNHHTYPFPPHNYLSLFMHSSLDLFSTGHSMASHGYSGQNTQQEEAGTDPGEKAPGQPGDLWALSQVVGVRKPSSHFAHWLTGRYVFLLFQREQPASPYLKLKQGGAHSKRHYEGDQLHLFPCQCKHWATISEH